MRKGVQNGKENINEEEWLEKPDNALIKFHVFNFVIWSSVHLNTNECLKSNSEIKTYEKLLHTHLAIGHPIRLEPSFPV